MASSIRSPPLARSRSTPRQEPPWSSPRCSGATMTAALYTRERKRQRPATVEERLEGWACRARKPRSEKNGLPASHRRSRLPPFTDSILAITRISASPPQVAATSLERCSCKRSRLAWLCRLAQPCQPSSKASQNRTANEQDGRRWTERKSNRYLCSSSASICVHLWLKIPRQSLPGIA